MDRPSQLRRFSARAEATPPVNARPFWRFEAKGSGDTELWIYDEISWWGVSAADFQKELAAIDTETITLRLNSPGGDVFDGIAIGNLLREHPATVNVKVDALAASIASVIAVLGGDTVTMGRNSQMMIHDAMGFAFGNAQDMLDTAELLDMISNNIAGVYADKAGGDVASWRETMKAETWYTADEAVAAGLADSVAPARSEDKAAAKYAAKWVAEMFPTQGARFAAMLTETDPSGTSEVAPVPEGPANGDTAELPTAATVLPPADPAPPVVFSGETNLAETIRAAVGPPKVDLADWRLAFDFAAVTSGPDDRPKPTEPVKLPPLAPVAEATPVPRQSELGALIDGAVHYEATHQPEPDAPANPAHTNGNPPFALDVDTVRRAVREAKF